jgi:TRAP-type C4-dicarboxylate transport system substrate-binding protein
MTLGLTLKKLVLGVVVASATSFVVGTASAQTFKIATLSPGGSYWVKSFKEGAKEIAERTEDRVKFKFYPGGVMGGDLTVLRKMKIGQLQGGAMAAGALYGQYPDASLLGIPFTFESQAELDFVRDRLAKEIAQGAREKGLVITGIMGGGAAYILSQKEAHSFDDVKDHKVWVPDNDPQTADTLKKIGLNPVPLGVGDVLTGLQTGLIDTVSASPVVAIALQWHTRVNYMVKVPVLYLTGVVVLNERDFAKVSDADQAIVLEVFGRIADDIHQKNIEDNAKAYEAMVEQGIKIIEPQGDDLQTWEALKTEVRALIGGNNDYSPQLMAKVQELKAEFKNQLAKN